MNFVKASLKTTLKSCLCTMASALVLSANQAAWAAPAEPVLIPTAEVETIRENQQPFFLDVRTAEEIKELGTLSDYYNIPVDELENRLDELPKNRLILTA